MTDRHIGREELEARIGSDDGPVLVEALPAKYFEHAHLPGAINIPHDAIDTLAARLLPDKSAEIVTYCASATCKNSGIAAQRLRELGYRNVREYVEGKADWIAAGLPVETEGERARAVA
jgi:rhodanese-related sulfurtransferase